VVRPHIGVKGAGMASVLVGGALLLAGCGTPASTAGGNGSSATAARPFAIDQTWDPFAGLTIMNPNSSTNAIMQWILEPLAIQSGRVLNGPYYPEVASKWQMKGNTLTIWLRQNEGWSNGQPVTAQDVKTSLELGYIESYAFAPYLGPIKIINSHELTVTENKPYAMFEPEILNAEIYSNAEYGRFIPKNLPQMYVTSLHTGAKATADGRIIAKLTKEVAAYKKTYFLGNGPYEISGVTSGELTLKVNPHYWNAKNIKVPQVVIYNVQGNNQAWGDYLGNKVDWGQYIVNKQILAEWLHHPGHQYNAPLGNSTSNLVFNTTAYPFNMIQVRQALAYLINRKTLTAEAEPVMGYPIKYPTGFSVAVTMGSLTKQELGQLNTYPYDPTKAGQLLKSAGFKKTSQGWMMPNGKPFNSSIYIYSGATDWALAASQMAKDFSTFGLKTNVKSINQDTYWSANVQSPGYPMFMDYGGGTAWGLLQAQNVLSWWSYYETLQGTTAHASGYTSLASAESVALSNGQSVNIPAETWKLVTSTPAQTNNLVWQLSQAYNKDMVTLPLWDGINGSLYSTDYYTGWPAKSSDAWVLWSQNGSNAGQNVVAFFLAQGWIHPK
jgi:peptide/nickel transport system substrate-binding protein